MSQHEQTITAQVGDLVLIERRTVGHGTHYEIGTVTQTGRTGQVTAFQIPYTVDGATGKDIRAENLAAGSRVMCALAARRYDVTSALRAYQERRSGSSFYTAPLATLQDADQFLARYLR
ncbi:hypothetical protein [Kitasatospora sp. GP82]|uniref:hypothetical protein n=1 Tax=Kitasatospora sp. GP82 TaxID=3035089 RepID=UPI002475B365|nr:hypothetical protein [Kitasatospora sp. GP82]MDH6129803.1 hypothetical protein [Kitasatospora sp. GP82]